MSRVGTSRDQLTSSFDSRSGLPLNANRNRNGPVCKEHGKIGVFVVFRAVGMV